MADTTTIARPEPPGRARADVHPPGVRLLVAEVDAPTQVLEVVVIEWSPSKRYLKGLVDPSHKPTMCWFDTEKKPLLCLEKLPELQRRKKDPRT